MHSKIYGASKRYNPALRGVSWVALVVKNPPSNAGDHKKCGFNLWFWNILWSRK